MENVICKKCESENVYYSKKKKKYCCEDCGAEFEISKILVPQKIFISYGHDKNREFVEEIKTKLLQRGHYPWIDSSKIKPGEEWRSKIMEGIGESNEFLAFISEYSTRDPGVCLDEIAIALGIRECVIQSILVEKEVYPPNSISYNQWLDFSDWKEIKKKGEFIWNNWLNKKMEELFNVIENPENHYRANEVEKIKKKLDPIIPDIKISLLLKGNIVQRKWLLDYIMEWIYKKDRIFILIGNPGAGKSVVSALLSNYIRNVVAVYFIDWKNEDTQSIEKFICSIAFQLACNIKDYRKKLIYILNNNMHNNSTICFSLSPSIISFKGLINIV